MAKMKQLQIDEFESQVQDEWSYDFPDHPIFITKPLTFCNGKSVERDVQSSDDSE
ncbi:hypothetical protein Xoosp13_97 [Xanthomonas phage Xoo-sp13]|nr:hypothetical protein Xoosp13_97 [Xanthomonas phage Xoo-sp13]